VALLNAWTTQEAGGRWLATASTSPLRWAAVLGLATGLHVAGLVSGAWGWGSDPVTQPQAGKHKNVALILNEPEAAFVPETRAFRGKPEPLEAPAPARPLETRATTAPVVAANSTPVRLQSQSAATAALPDVTPETFFRAPGAQLTPARGTGRAPVADDRHEIPLAAGPTPTVTAQPPPSSPGKRDAWDKLAASFDTAQQSARKPGLHLPGKPAYPNSCRSGTCKSGVPCQGVARWRILAEQAGTPPAKVEVIKGAGCALLDASTRKFLLNSAIPEKGDYEIVIRFELMDE